MSGTAHDFGTPLTPGEIKVLRLIAEGPRSNRQVAELLWVTEQAVKFHLVNVFRKLGVKDRHAAIACAREQGLLPAEANADAAELVLRAEVAA